MPGAFRGSDDREQQLAAQQRDHAEGDDEGEEKLVAEHRTARAVSRDEVRAEIGDLREETDRGEVAEHQEEEDRDPE
ncbi:hypothetical protein LTR94_032505, partial [Friedmanniomyces endolithicus]